MAQTYFTLLTTIGQAKIANAIALGQNVEWSSMAVGDGNGNPTAPTEAQTALVRETYRAPLNQLGVDPENPNYIVAEMVIPTDVGGWSVNEVGLFDADDNLVAVANFPATYKPVLTEGSGRDLVVRILIQLSNSSVVTLKIDPAIVLASRKWVVDNFLLRSKVAGGTTGQVLVKTANANEAFGWVDPTAAVNVIVSTKTEKQTLAADQVIVTLATMSTQAVAVFIEGVRLIEGDDFSITNGTQFTLTQSYPAGTRIVILQNEQISQIVDATTTQRGFVQLATTAEAQALLNDVHVLTSKKLADAFKGGNQSLNRPGYQKLPGGLIVQWGGGGTFPGNEVRSIVFPLAFPNGVLSVSLQDTGSNSTSNASWKVLSKSLTGLSVRSYADSNENTYTFDYIVIGY